MSVPQCRLALVAAAVAAREPTTMQTALHAAVFGREQAPCLGPRFELRNQLAIQETPPIQSLAADMYISNYRLPLADQTGRLCPHPLRLLALYFDLIWSHLLASSNESSIIIILI